MNLDARSVSKTTAPDASSLASTSGTLGKCLVEGNARDELRSRRRKQRALILSIAFQSLVLAAILLFPLLGKSEKISLNVNMLPPFPRLGTVQTQPTSPHISPTPHPCRFCAPTRISPTISTTDPNRTTNSDPESGPTIPGLGDPNGLTNGIPNSSSDRGPKPPQVVEKSSIRQRISEPLQTAMLIHRVEPIYPPLAIQIHHEGRVELRAVIATDGCVQSLEVISGDPLLIQSALTAVRQWRYRPTYLNNTPVEVDTRITVVYTINH